MCTKCTFVYQIKRTTNQNHFTMKNYKVYFGTGSEQVVFIYENMVTFSEAVQRMEYTGLDMTAITKIEEY